MSKLRTYRATFTHDGIVVGTSTVRDLYMEDALRRAKAEYDGPTPYGVSIVKVEEREMGNPRRLRFTIAFDNDQGYMIVDNKLLITIYRSQNWQDVEKKFNAMPNADELIENFS